MLCQNMFDANSYLIGLVMVYILAAVYLIFINSEAKTKISGTGFFFAYCLLSIGSIIGMILGLKLPGKLSILTINLTAYFAFAFASTGIDRFENPEVRKIKKSPYMIASFSSIIHIFFTTGLDNIVYRFACYALGSSSLMLFCMMGLRKNRETLSKTKKVLISFISVYIIATIIRFLYVLLIDAPPGAINPEYGTDLALQGLIGLGISGFTIGLVFLVTIKIAENTKQIVKRQAAQISETHHRMKNNLALIQSLLLLEAKRHGKGSEAEKSLKECAGRISSIVDFHGMLSEDKRPLSARLDIYLTKIVKNIVYDGSERKIKTNYSLSPINADLDSTICCGLLIYEIVSNACKYGAPEQGKMTLNIGAETYADAQGHKRIRLTASDNGPGIPAKYVNNPKLSFGTHIIHLLTNQLRGEYRINAENGTKYEISFPV